MDEKALILELEQLITKRAKSPTKISSVKKLLGGACQDNFRIDLEVEQGVLQSAKRLVLRCDAPLGIPRSLKRKDEFEVISAAFNKGVNTPRVYWVFEGYGGPKRDAYLMDWCDGIAIGSQVLRHPDLSQARNGLTNECAVELAKIHQIKPQEYPDLFPTSIPVNPITDSLDWIESWLDELADPYPALEFALAWLKDNPPTNKELCLVHGDFRTGNLLVTPKGLAGVLDWEFAHWGCLEEDLAWISVRDWRFGVNDKPVGGFGLREEFYEAYERESGRAISRTDVHFWEILGNIRWAAGCVHQASRYLSGERKDLELLAIGRRVAEMQYEALRLIEVSNAR